MIAYQIAVNGKQVAIAGVREGVVSAIADWVFVHSNTATDPNKDWRAGFSVAAHDEVISENLKWFRCALRVGDEITIKLIETERVDPPSERERKD